MFRSVSTVLGYTLRAVRDTKTPMIISAVSNGMNVVLNTLFIYILGLGVAGAAIASAISYAAAGLLLFWFYRRNAQLHWPWQSFAVDGPLLRETAEVGMPVLGTSLGVLPGVRGVLPAWCPAWAPPSLRPTPSQ